MNNKTLIPSRCHGRARSTPETATESAADRLGQGALQSPQAGSYLLPAWRPQRAPNPKDQPSCPGQLEFAPLATRPKGVLVLFCEEGLKFGSAARRVIEPTGDL